MSKDRHGARVLNKLKVEIMVLNIPSVMGTDDYNWLLGLVSEEKRARVKKLRFLRDAYRTLLGEALVRAAIASRLEIGNERIHFARNEYGKPSLIGHESLQFNVSHSGDWVALFVSDVPVGIDVEEIRPIDMNIAESFLSVLEYNRLMSHNQGERLAHFYELWTLKESYIKCKGEGLSIPLHSFSILVNEDRSVSLEPSGGHHFFKTYELDRNYKLAACAEVDRFPPSITKWSFEELRTILEWDWSKGII
ncbi:4'-phosphopantetheinyl transferase family protein [Paenibacillus paeoniae]|uniref:Phosphopantetheinyl transferase n=1 Tax=Paenibacillus paeoniae TaxID=2292705 RepID=A0A371PEE3_9BACL|nr:4'-phosphopantetheinyl transferase superfamily protein [Paenibacillus paeoniae]REK74292.1 phosphopantetheinyl transferase [Paenibacillus paeoniae]